MCCLLANDYTEYKLYSNCIYDAKAKKITSITAKKDNICSVVYSEKNMSIFVDGYFDRDCCTTYYIFL